MPLNAWPFTPITEAATRSGVTSPAQNRSLAAVDGSAAQCLRNSSSHLQGHHNLELWQYTQYTVNMHPIYAMYSQHTVNMQSPVVGDRP